MARKSTRNGRTIYVPSCCPKNYFFSPGKARDCEAKHNPSRSADRAHRAMRAARRDYEEEKWTVYQPHGYRGKEQRGSQGRKRVLKKKRTRAERRLGKELTVEQTPGGEWTVEGLVAELNRLLAPHSFEVYPYPLSDDTDDVLIADLTGWFPGGERGEHERLAGRLVVDRNLGAAVYSVESSADPDRWTDEPTSFRGYKRLAGPVAAVPSVEADARTIYKMIARDRMLGVHGALGPARKNPSRVGAIRSYAIMDDDHSKWGSKKKYANWTTYPTYSYEQFYRANPARNPSKGASRRARNRQRQQYDRLMSYGEPTEPLIGGEYTLEDHKRRHQLGYWDEDRQEPAPFEMHPDEAWLTSTGARKQRRKRRNQAKPNRSKAARKKAAKARKVGRLLPVPKRMKMTPRAHAEGISAIGVPGKWPIGDLPHARLALVYALSPSHKKVRRKVLNAVAANYPEYNWAGWWNKKARGKGGVKSWSAYVKGASQHKHRAAANPDLRWIPIETFGRHELYDPDQTIVRPDDVEEAKLAMRQGRQWVGHDPYRNAIMLSPKKGGEMLLLVGEMAVANPKARKNFWGGKKAAPATDTFTVRYEVWVDRMPRKGSKKFTREELAAWYHGTLADPSVDGVRVKSASGISMKEIANILGVKQSALNNPKKSKYGLKIGRARPQEMPRNAGPYLPQMYPYGQGGVPATYYK